MPTLTHEGLPDHAQVDGHAEDWAQTFDKLAQLLKERKSS
jgi:hypothetical protein